MWVGCGLPCDDAWCAGRRRIDDVRPWRPSINMMTAAARRRTRATTRMRGMTSPRRLRRRRPAVVRREAPRRARHRARRPRLKRRVEGAGRFQVAFVECAVLSKVRIPNCIAARWPRQNGPLLARESYGVSTWRACLACPCALHQWGCARGGPQTLHS